MSAPILTYRKEACAAALLTMQIHRAACNDQQCDRDFLAWLTTWLDDRLDVDEPEPGRKVMNEAGHLHRQAQELLAALEPACPQINCGKALVLCDSCSTIVCTVCTHLCTDRFGQTRRRSFDPAPVTGLLEKLKASVLGPLGHAFVPCDCSGGPRPDSQWCHHVDHAIEVGHICGQPAAAHGEKANGTGGKP